MGKSAGLGTGMTNIVRICRHSVMELEQATQWLIVCIVSTRIEVRAIFFRNFLESKMKYISYDISMT